MQEPLQETKQTDIDTPKRKQGRRPQKRPFTSKKVRVTELKNGSKMEFEDILKAVGEYGRYQKKLVYFYIIPTTTVFAIYCMNTFFMLSIPDAWCTVPELAHLSPALQQALSRPLLNGSLDLLDSCSHYSLNYSQVLHRYEHSWNQDNFSLSAEEKKASTSSCSNGWTFDKSNFDETAVSYLGLVCDQANWVALILTIHGIGEVLGNPFFGSLSDTLGRRLTFFLTLAVAVASSSSPIIFRGLWVFAISRFFNSATAASMFNLPYIICKQEIMQLCKFLCKLMSI